MMAKKRPLLVLIDGYAVAYRAYFALPAEQFRASDGTPTNAVYGFTRLILDVLEEHPDYFAVSFDKGLSGRETLYPEYKGTRDKMPDDLRAQIDAIEAMVAAFNLPLLAQEGMEADDMIGTAARQAEEQGCQVRIISGDRDLLQLLSAHTSVQLPQRGAPDKVWDMETFRQAYAGLQPPQLVDLKGLMGDSSDNIPGVKGIGEKGAKDLIKTFGSIAELYAHLDAVDTRLRNKLTAEGQREMAFLSRDLATIQRDLDTALDLEACLAKDFDPAQVLELFDKLDFGDTQRKRLQKLAETYAGEAAAQIQFDRPLYVPGYTIVTTTEQLAALVDALQNAHMIAFDTETTGLDKMQVELVGIALAVDAQHGYYIPVGHRARSEQPTLFGDDQIPPQLPLQTVIDALRPPLTNPQIAKVAHNASYDLVILRRYGIDIAPISDDTMLAEWVRDPDSRHLGLKSLAAARLHLRMQDIDALIGSGAKQITMDRVPVEEAGKYAAADAVATYRLLEVLREDLNNAEQPKARSLYETLEIPFIPVLANMEMAGVLIDTAHFKALSQEMNAKQSMLEEQIHALAGEKFNVSSYQQLNTILFEKLQISTAGLKKNRSAGGFSLTAAVLEELAERNDHPIFPLIMEYRSLAKLLGTYIDALPNLVNPHTGRVHTSFNQTGAVTGRLSSSNPNLQNIPIRTEEGRRVRRGFIAAPGNVLLSVDYSQIELRILAHYSGDETLRAAFAAGQDIHRTTAAKVYGVAAEAVSYDQRRFAKSVNFGLMYGMGAFRLARDSNLTLAEADAFIKAYFDNFPGVRDWLQATKDFAAQYGYVETLFGRRRRFPELQRDDTSHVARQRAEREAINSPIQGTAADIIKNAMLEIDQRLQGSPSQMLLQVHDELVFEVPEDDLETMRALVVEIMQNAGEAVLSVPVVADSRWGKNWMDAD